MLERLSFYIRHSINDLRVNRQRTLFALLCIAAGVAAIVSLQTLAVMMNNALEGSLQETNRGDIRLMPTGRWGQNIIELDTENVMFSGNIVFTATGIQNIQDWLDEHYAGSKITYQQVMYGGATLPNGLSASIPERDTTKPLVWNYLIDPDEYPLYGDVKSLDGKSLSDMLISPTDIVISENLAEELEAQVGDLVRITGSDQDFTLRGIVPTDAEMGLINIFGHLFGYYYLDQEAINYFEGAEAGYGSTAYIQLSNPDDVDEADERLNRFGRGFETITTTDILEANSAVSDTIDNMVVIMGLVSLLIGGIGIVNTMMVIVSRRTTEVAVLKTIGLEPDEVVLLFLVEAILMGIIGSLLGIFGGWILAYLVKGVGENFLGQQLTFSIAPRPAIIGFFVGIVITTIFGFLPTLAAGQIRPANVLRPSANVIPTSGRLSAFVAMVAMIMAISLVAQSLLGTMLHDVTVTGDITLELIATIIGGLYGALMVVPWVIGDYLGMRERQRGRSWALRSVLWAVLLVAAPTLGALFGAYVPAILILTATIIITGYLYITLWLVIWATGGGGGRIEDISWGVMLLYIVPIFWPVILLSPFLAGWIWLKGRDPDLAVPMLLIMLIIPIFWPLLAMLVMWLLVRDNWPGILVLAFPLFWPLIVILPVIILPTWIIGRIIQNFMFIDFKIAMRSMLSTKARGASTLLALVVGVFTLSIITMLVDTFTNMFEQLLQDITGGNVMIAAAGGSSTIDDVVMILDENDEYVRSYAVVAHYQSRLLDYYDASANRELTNAEQSAILWEFEGIDGRQITSNLPDLDFEKGRNLDPALDSQPDADGYWSAVIMQQNEEENNGSRSFGDIVGIGDTFTLSIGGNRNEQLKYRVVGIAAEGGVVVSNSDIYVPLASLSDYESDDVSIFADVDEDHIKEVRKAVQQVPGTFVLETRFLNDLVNRFVDQFTSFPLLVATLSLVTGGIVIANSVALSTLERKREIGIMKAVGLQRERVLGMLLLENGLMGIVGGLIGVGISFVGLLLLLIVTFQGDFGRIVPYQTAFMLMALCVGISLVAALLSVWGASGEKPLNVLRYE